MYKYFSYGYYPEKLLRHRNYKDCHQEGDNTSTLITIIHVVFFSISQITDTRAAAAQYGLNDCPVTKLQYVMSVDKSFGHHDYRSTAVRHRLVILQFNLCTLSMSNRNTFGRAV